MSGPKTTLDNRLAALEQMPLVSLRAEWEQMFGNPAPPKAANYLRARLGAAIQEAEHRDLVAVVRARLRAIAASSPAGRPLVQAKPAVRAPRAARAVVPGRDPRLPPIGTVLRRRWNGLDHEVHITSDGFRWNGSTFDSLSAVAKAITLTKWNGFRFFQLDQEAA